MIIIPAIDIRREKVVRLIQGDFNKETVYSSDPVNIAVKWQMDGAKMIHIVDLDGAFSGKLKNLGIVKKIVSRLKIPVELGGGLRSEEDIDKAVLSGVKRVILGTKACRDMVFLKKMLKKYRDMIAVSIDAVKDKPVENGWQKPSQIDIDDLIKKMDDTGVKTIIYTDILKDGMMKGPNLEMLKKVSDASCADIIASGGVSCLKDIEAIKNLNCANIKGIIVGKALYENSFNIKSANELLSKK